MGMTIMFFQYSSYRKDAELITKNTGCKGAYSLMKLPHHDPIMQTTPDVMHTVKDTIVKSAVARKRKQFKLELRNYCARNVLYAYAYVPHACVEPWLHETCLRRSVRSTACCSPCLSTSSWSSHALELIVEATSQITHTPICSRIRTRCMPLPNQSDLSIEIR